MFGLGEMFWQPIFYEQDYQRLRERAERQAWNFRMLRGPMVEADIDWRVANPHRLMVEGDL